MTDAAADAKAVGDKEKRLKRKQSLESSVTLGLGYGKKKQRMVDAFYSAVWPVLHDAGWTLVKGEGDEEGATYFLPPGVTMGNKGEKEDALPQTSSKANPSSSREEDSWECPSCGYTNPGTKSRCTEVVGEGRCKAWRGGKRLPYFSKVRDVIEKILEKKCVAEAKAADVYVELVPDASDIFVDQKDKKRMPSPSSSAEQKTNDLAWKDERTHFEKSSSRVGPEFQVDILPAAGSHTSSTASVGGYDGGALYERAWNPSEAKKLGKLDFVHTRVKFNKRESVYDLFHSRGYRLPGFYQEVSNLNPTDCSDWTKADKDRFRAAVFEKHENMKEVSAMIGKPINECITYYLVKFKRTKSYKSLKRSMKRKANLSEGSAGTLVCNGCGKGGMLIACDTCEAHYHLACATPPLERIPDGAWNCGNCRRETRSMLPSQDEMSCSTDHNPTEGSADVSIKGSGKPTSKGSSGDTEMDGSGDLKQFEFNSLVGSTQGGKSSDSGETDGSHSYKRMRMDEVNMTTDTAVTAVPV